MIKGFSNQIDKKKGHCIYVKRSTTILLYTEKIFLDITVYRQKNKIK